MATYYGGKNHLFRSIINLIPEHSLFVELFAGSAAVGRNLERRHAEAFLFELDPEQAKRLRVELPGHRVFNQDSLAWLEHHAPALGPDTVLFADPPYPLEDRRDTRHRYRCEFTDEQHETLARLLRSTRARVLVCGHPWGLYPKRFSDWKRHEFRVILRSGKPGIECVWTNYADPFPLHDYRFFGDNKRVRQDLHRQIARQLEKFDRMDKHARAAVLRALVSRFGVAAPVGATADQDLEVKAPSPSSAVEGDIAYQDLEGAPASTHRRP